MRIERHIFGSFRGYTTLARSAGVSSEDCRLLESTAFSFGQTDDRRFLKSLGNSPAYFTRVLPGGRRGLTRVLEGPLDDNNRPTLCLITALVGQRDWDGGLWGDPGLLLEIPGLWEWDGAMALGALEIEPPPPSLAVSRKSVPRLLSLLSEVERTWGSGRALIVSPEEFSLAELRALEMLIPPSARRQFTTACRSLSAQLPVTVNCLASATAATGQFTFCAQAAPALRGPYAAFLEQTQLPSGLIPVEQIAEYRGFGERGNGAAARRVPAPAVVAVDDPPAAEAEEEAAASPRSPWMLMGIAAGMLVAGLLMTGWAVFRGREAGPDLAVVERERARAANEQAGEFAEKLHRVLEVPRSDVDAMLAEVRARLDAAKKMPAPLPVVPQPAPQRIAIRPALPVAVEDRDTLRAFYITEKARQTERFEQLKGDMGPILSGLDVGKLVDELPEINRLHQSLKMLRDEWPIAGDEAERRWVGELAAAKAQVAELAVVGQAIVRLRQTLEQSEALIEQAGDAPDAKVLGQVRLNAEEAKAALAGLPEKLSRTNLSLAGVKADARQRLSGLRGWLEARDRASTRPAVWDLGGRGGEGEKRRNGESGNWRIGALARREPRTPGSWRNGVEW